MFKIFKWIVIVFAVLVVITLVLLYLPIIS